MASLDPGATTFDELTSEIVASLLGYVRDQESATHLTTAANDSDTQLSADNVGETAGVGAIEIDDEIMWVQSVDRTNNTIQVAPYGRGWQGSTAADHDLYARVTFAPRFPRLRVKRAINQIIAGMGDQLPTLGTTEFEAESGVISYEMPADSEQVLDIRWESVGATDRWIPVRRYEPNFSANSTAFTTGKSIDIFDGIVAGQTIRITYQKNPTLLSDGSDVFTDTGWPAQVYDVVVYGVMAQLVAAVDASRLDFKSVEADQLDTPTPMGSAMNLSKYFKQLYLQRLDEERRNFLNRMQPRVRRNY